MSIIESIILGIVQGITEFLPVSSSAHLIIISRAFNFKPNIAFDVMLHSASLIAIIFYFRKFISLNTINIFKGDRDSRSKSISVWIKIGLASMPALIAYLFFGDKIEDMHDYSLITALALIIMGIPLIFLESIKNRNIMGINQLSYPKSVLVGLFQGLALIPGVSRSGSSIIGGLSIGLKKEKAREFAFLISMPIIAGSFIMELMDIIIDPGIIAGIDLITMAAGFIAAALSSFFALKLLMKIMRNTSLAIFGVYRIILGLVLILLNN